MKYKWLNKQNNENIIVFFNGWGMDEFVVKDLNPENYDVLMFYNYNSPVSEFDLNLLNNYKKRHLIAWSMGVMTATLYNINWDTKTAINGTLKPVSDKFGIPVRIYELTLKNFSLLGAEKFFRAMFRDDVTPPKIKRDFEEQKTELAALKEYKGNENFKYDRIIISSEDKIIPPKNQTAFWGIEPNIVSGHAPFNLFKNWSELL